MAEPVPISSDAATTPESLPTEIPNRLFFRIGDVADILGVEAYVLRYWETEFPMLKPKKGSNGHREYRRKDVETALEIKRLLYDEGYTIAGARKALKQRSKAKRGKTRSAAVPVQSGLFGASIEKADRSGLDEIKRELREIIEMLK